MFCGLQTCSFLRGTWCRMFKSVLGNIPLTCRATLQASSVVDRDSHCPNHFRLIQDLRPFARIHICDSNSGCCYNPISPKMGIYWLCVLYRNQIDIVQPERGFHIANEERCYSASIRIMRRRTIIWVYSRLCSRIAKAQPSAVVNIFPSQRQR